MKEIKKKNIICLIISCITLICFIIANWGFAFRTKDGLCIDLIYINKLLEETKNIAGFTYIRDSFGLMISGFIFCGLAVLVSLISIGISFEDRIDNKQTRDKSSLTKEEIEKLEKEKQKKLEKNHFLIHLSIYILILLGFMLLMVGEIIFIIWSNANYNIWYILGMFIFTALPLISIFYFLKETINFLQNKKEKN